MEDEAKAWLPSGAIATLDSVEGWEGSETPLHVRYKIDIPAFATVAGKRLLIPAALFKTTRQKQAFQPAERKYAVYFTYAYEEIDNLNFQMPEGYTAESVPSPQDVKLEYTHFATARRITNNQFVSQRVLIINGVLFPVAQYAELKGFFEKLQAADEEQLVLQSSAATASQ